MILAVDSGNSRVKWGTHDGKKWSHTGEVERHDIELLERVWHGLPQPRKIVVCNVAGDIAQARLARMLSQWSVAPIWCIAQPSQCGVVNGYDDASQLGPDRWAALIGARHLEKRACLVVTCGTALTVDSLSDAGVFLGGVIAPGFELMQQSLVQNTSALKDDRGTVIEFPFNTADAIMSGVTAASLGAVDYMTRSMQRAGCAARCCVVSGGNSRFIEPYLTLEMKVVKNLVLEGLIRIALEKP